MQVRKFLLQILTIIKQILEYTIGIIMIRILFYLTLGTHTISNNKNRQESMELEALSSRLQEPEKAPPDLYLSSPNGHFIKVTTESTAL